MWHTEKKMDVCSCLLWAFLCVCVVCQPFQPQSDPPPHRPFTLSVTFRGNRRNVRVQFPAICFSFPLFCNAIAPQKSPCGGPTAPISSSLDELGMAKQASKLAHNTHTHTHTTTKLNSLQSLSLNKLSKCPDNFAAALHRNC